MMENDYNDAICNVALSRENALIHPPQRPVSGCTFITMFFQLLSFILCMIKTALGRAR